MYGDSLMTHAMILTAVTDKVWQQCSDCVQTAYKRQVYTVCVWVCVCLSMDLAPIFLHSSRTERKAMRNGEWKTPGAMTVVIKVRYLKKHPHYAS